MKKSSFWTFVFSVFPGAGHMYLGMMKKGASLMLAFCGVIAVAGFFNLNFLLILMPVIWFYSFFDAINLCHLPYEQRLEQEDHFLFGADDFLKKDWLGVAKKRHLLVGGVCIFFGVWMLFQTCIEPYMSMLYNNLPWLYRLINSMPTILVATCIILLGVYLVGGGKKNKEPIDTDYIEYGGNRDE